jgi:hypothetical protein
MLGHISAQLQARNKTSMKEEVGGHDPLDQLPSAAEIDDGSEWGCGWQSAACEDLARSKRDASNRCPREPVTAQRLWDRDLDRIARVHTQSVEPSRCESRESRALGQSPCYCIQ